MDTSPFHDGERAAQERAGETDAAHLNARILTPHLPAGALPFLTRQRLVVVATVGASGDPWASILFGPPGFADAPRPELLELTLDGSSRDRTDPMWAHLRSGAPVGTLFLELATRRRLRVNGRVAHLGPARLGIAVEQAYPNCPKYIQRRIDRPEPPAFADPAPPRHGSVLEAGHRRWIAGGDTMFVASIAPDAGADASHRGGNPGFVDVLDGRTLRIPDYAGNSMFNTLGNLTRNPRAGLLFLDFSRPAVLQLTGRTELLWSLDLPDDRSGGTGRYWTFTVERWIERELIPTASWSQPEPSPFNPQ